MNKELSYLVSNFDLENKFKSTPGRIKIMLYPELNGTEDIMDLLPSNKCACFILLKTSEQAGHWTCLCRKDNYIYYFDSYGIGADGELSRISPGIRYQLNETERSLIRLLKTIPHGFSFSWNSKQFQEYSSNINTCGKWVEVFVKCVFKNISLQQFQENMESMKKQNNTSYDILVCNLWNTL